MAVARPVCDGVTRATIDMSLATPLRLLCALLCVGWIASTGAKPAPAPAPKVNDVCLACHGPADAKRDDGRSIAVDSDKFGASVHGQLNLQCTDCHADVSPEKIPHAAKLKPVALFNSCSKRET